MKILRLAIIGFLLAATVAAAAATFFKVGAESVDNPAGVSLRQESAGHPHGFGIFFLRSHTRTHLGGGLSGGK